MNERIDQIIAEMSEQDVSEAIGESDLTWLCDAAAYASKNGDWLYVQTQWNKHAPPLIREFALGEYERETISSNGGDGYYTGYAADDFELRSLFTPLCGPSFPIGEDAE